MSGKEKLNENDRLIINSNNESFLIKVSEILFIKAQEDYSTVHLFIGSNLMTHKLLKTWEEQLSEKVFLRIHRSVIININYIDKIRKTKRSFEIFLKDHDEKFIVSQRFAVRFKTKFVV